ncbi:MAG: hypothetical protein ACHQT5_01745 [Candidatus Saccharimonadales bacterium]
MSERNSGPLRAFDLNSDEMVIGDFRQSAIEPPQLWDAAVETRRKVLSGFHVVRAVRPEMNGEPMQVNTPRTEVAALASQLVDAALDYELPVLLADIAAEGGSGAPEN